MFRSLLIAAMLLTVAKALSIKIVPLSALRLGHVSGWISFSTSRVNIFVELTMSVIAKLHIMIIGGCWSDLDRVTM